MNSEAYIQGYLFKEAADNDTLQLLIQAKEHSDKSDYAKKRDIMRKLLKREAHNFTVDSRNRTVLGLTHIPSGFRIHMPERDVYDLMEKTAEDIYRPFTDAEYKKVNTNTLINDTEGFRNTPYRCSL